MSTQARFFDASAIALAAFLSSPPPVLAQADPGDVFGDLFHVKRDVVTRVTVN